MKEEPNQIAFEELDQPDFVARLISGEEHAFDVMYEVAARRLKSHVLRLFRETLNAKDAEDVVEEALFKVHQAITNFDPDRRSLKAWLLRTAVNTAKNHRKWRSREKRDPLVRSETVSLEDLPDQAYRTEEFQSPQAPPPTTSKKGRFSDEKAELIKSMLAHLNNEGRLVRIREALKNISHKSRDILLMTVEKSDDEIAEELDISAGNLRVLRLRALKEFIGELQRLESR